MYKAIVLKLFKEDIEDTFADDSQYEEFVSKFKQPDLDEIANRLSHYLTDAYWEGLEIATKEYIDGLWK